MGSVRGELVAGGTLSPGVTIPSETSLMLRSASSAVRKKNCAFSFSTSENLL